MYAKLSATITRSSVWREPPAVRCVWIALLALANEDGFVKGVEGWLSAEANVTPEECREALRKFQEPDLESQDQDYGGRRLEKVEGGWIVLNYPKYRDMRTKEQRLAAERQHRKRLKDKGIESEQQPASAVVTRRHATSRSVTAIASASASESEAVPARKKASRRADEPAVAADPPPTAAAAPSAKPPAPARVRLTAAVNAALDEKLGTNRDPVTSGTAANLVEAVVEHSIPLEWAEQHLHAAASAMERAPRSMQYFTPGLLEAWERHQAREAAAVVGRSPVALPHRTESLLIGAQRFRPADFFALCVRHGLAAPMQTRDTIAETVQRLAAQGLVEAPEQFLDLVLHVEPWALAEIKFGKAREERLQAAITSWRPSATVAA